LLAEWLAENYDIFVFDMRGHNESEGAWGDVNKLAQDIDSIVEFALANGYKKIGFVGRSAGAWLGLFAASRYRNIDSLVAISPPLGSIVTSKYQKISMILLSASSRLLRLVSVLLLGVSFERLNAEEDLFSILDDLPSTPVLFIFNRRDRFLDITSARIQKLGKHRRHGITYMILERDGHMIALEDMRRVLEAIDTWFGNTL